MLCDYHGSIKRHGKKPGNSAELWFHLVVTQQQITLIPAGLAFFKTSDVFLTPGVQFGKTKSMFRETNSTGTGQTKFNLGTSGFIFGGFGHKAKNSFWHYLLHNKPILIIQPIIRDQMIIAVMANHWLMSLLHPDLQ
jgi:hypothetical protein